MLCYVFMCFSLLVVVLDVFGVLALFSKFYIGVYYTCDCSCNEAEEAYRLACEHINLYLL